MRCSACATPGSEWAAYCSSCGASLDDALTIPNDAPIARQRRLAAGGHIARPAALSAAAIAGVIALVAVTAQLGGPRTAPPLGPHRLLYADSNQTMVSTLDGRLVADLSGWAAPGYPERAVTVGGAAFFVHDRTAWMVRSPFTDPPRALGPASHIFSAGARAVGLDNVVGSGPTMVVVRSTSGRAIGHPSTLPPNTQAVAGYGHRLLLQVGGADLEVWDTAGRKVVRHLGHTPGEVQGLIASHNSTVAWTSAGLCDATERCEIGVDDLVTGASHTVAPPLGHRSFSGEGAISPDGRLLACFVFTDDGTVRPGIVHLDNGHTDVLAPALGTGRVRNVAAWTSDGAWLLLGGPVGPLYAYSAAHPTTGVPLPAPSSFTVAAL